MNICLYHGSDLDGLCSGAIYARAHQGKDYVLVPIDYGNPIPWGRLENADVTLIDFSFQPWAEFQRLFDVAKSVVWIDHHKSAIEEFKRAVRQGDASARWGTSVLDESRAACELAWRHYHPEVEVPIAVRLLAAYDLWEHSDERTLAFQYGLRLHGLDPANGKDRKMWRDLLGWNYNPSEVIRTGTSILDYQKQKDAIEAKAWFPVDWEGLKWQACNRLGKGSTFFDSIRDSKNYHGMLSFSWDGHVWTIGLYSERDDVDCGAIAKRHGGGGHQGAAGFRSTMVPFDLVDRVG